MSAYNSPMPVNINHPRRPYEYMSPHNRWGAPAGRLSYYSPLGMSNQVGEPYMARIPAKGIYSSSDESVGSPNFANPRIVYGSPLGSPISCSLNLSSDRSRYSEFADNHIQSISRIVQDDSSDFSSGERSDGPGPRHQMRSTLPAWILDSNGQIKLSLSEVLKAGHLKTFARDKLGCQFLQQNYPAENSEDRIALSQQVLENEEIFEALCSDVFGNFFVQRMIDVANANEQRWISTRLLNKMYSLCLNRYSCRVVQKAIEILPSELKSVLLLELHKADIVRLSIDQNANHVVQKILHCFPVSNWAFIVDSLISRKEHLFAVAENKYGCRVVQLAIEALSNQKKSPLADRLLTGIMGHISAHCERLASNEFANYVIQHIIKAGPLHMYRDAIIEDCILRNILSMSQEKYASHVVEKSLEYAPPHLLKEMMDEIFDGYVPHPETRKDALDIMLFHQYGNYVVQRMLSICVEAARAYASEIKLHDMEYRLEWLQRLKERIIHNEGKLSKGCPSVRGPLDSMQDLAPALPSGIPITVAIPRSYI